MDALAQDFENLDKEFEDLETEGMTEEEKEEAYKKQMEEWAGDFDFEQLQRGSLAQQTRQLMKAGAKSRSAVPQDDEQEAQQEVSQAMQFKSGNYFLCKATGEQLKCKTHKAAKTKRLANGKKQLSAQQQEAKARREAQQQKGKKPKKGQQLPDLDEVIDEDIFSDDEGEYDGYSDDEFEDFDETALRKSLYIHSKLRKF